jgi:hypothetical protein
MGLARHAPQRRRLGWLRYNAGELTGGLKIVHVKAGSTAPSTDRALAPHEKAPATMDCDFFADICASK